MSRFVFFEKIVPCDQETISINRVTKSKNGLQIRRDKHLFFIEI